MVNPEIPSWRKTVQSEIVAVTVYADRALVTRRGVVDLTGIEQELVITSVPEIETESVRVSGTGTVGVRMLGVSSDRIYTTEPVAELAHLTRQIEQLEAEKRHLQAQVDALALQSSFIAGLREKTEEPFAQSLSRKNLSLSETLDFLNFLGSQYSEYAIASEECKTQQQELDKELQLLCASLQKIQTPHPKESFSLVVGVEVAGEGEFELELSYLVNCASWTPLYDLRFSTTSDIVHLSYLAEITQSTGEDWIGANLTLSTAKPGLGTLPPKLEPWYIDA
ncbi:MAG: mucoidy inhibitor MuiA family protein, partial [Nostoc sp. C3-bin3]|nr:mucoidy inhibitor MuiA family protein [Nostoc sp. C3-bin3]